MGAVAQRLAVEQMIASASLPLVYCISCVFCCGCSYIDATTLK